MSTIPWYKNDKLFRSEVATGHYYEALVTSVLRDLGYTVRQEERKVRDHISEVEQYRKEIDILILNRKGEWIRLEVKSSSLEFTCVEDFPFRQPMVMARDRWDNLPHKLSAILCISQVTERIITINPRTSLYWEARLGPWESKRGYRQWKYYADKCWWRDWEEFLEALYKVCPKQGEPIHDPNQVCAHLKNIKGTKVGACTYCRERGLAGEPIPLLSNKQKFYKGDWKSVPPTDFVAKPPRHIEEEQLRREEERKVG